MLESQNIQLRLSEIRERLNAFGNDDDIEYRQEEADALATEYRQLESKYRVALIRESEEIESTPTPELDGEGRESRAMELDLEIRNYVTAALNDFPLEGREREYNDALKLSGVGTQLPWVALLSPEERAELRAATVAPSDADMSVRGILGRVFAASAADHLGVVSPMVPQGAANFPVLSGGASPGTVAAGADADETEAKITPVVLDPRRLTASYRIRQEDIHKLAMLEDSLRLDLAGAMMESRDKAVFNGNGASPNVSGFLDTASDDAALTAPDDPTAVAAFAAYASARAKLVDGRHAMSADSVRVVCGAQTYSHASELYQAGSGASAIEKFNPRVSAHIPAPASNIQTAVASRSVGRAVSVMWASIALIRDIYTGASKGEIVITATALWNFAILDAAGFSLLKFKLA